MNFFAQEVFIESTLLSLLSSIKNNSKKNSELWYLWQKTIRLKVTAAALEIKQIGDRECCLGVLEKDIQG